MRLTAALLLLAAAALVAAAIWLRGACDDGSGIETVKGFETAQTLAIVGAAIDLYLLESKNPPPMTMTELASNPRWAGLSVTGNATNEGVECLLVALRHPDLKTPLNRLPFTNPLGNTDGDVWTKAPEGSDDVEAKEILDAYGNPLVYITATHYAETLHVVRVDGKRLGVRAARRRSGAFYNPDGYQLISLGKDGTQNQGDPVDDFENFTREE